MVVHGVIFPKKNCCKKIPKGGCVTRKPESCLIQRGFAKTGYPVAFRFFQGQAMSHATYDPAFWRNVPKVLLHEHLDGGLRPQTLLALCQLKNISLPANTPEAVARWLQGNAQSGSLERYVAAFAPTVAAMGDAAACERVAFEAAEDAQHEGCVLAEFRMAPLLLEPHGLAGEAAVEALLAGLQRSSLPCAFIVCAMRSESSEHVERAARLAARYAGQGVVGFDLAGGERGYPATLHRRAIDIAREAGLGITLHAGEADKGERVLEAIALGATRIGHGVQIAMGEGAVERMAQVAAMAQAGRKVHFEVCPTSNTHTGVCQHLSEHPLPAMWAAGLELSIHTDNRLISGVSHSEELANVHRMLGWPLAAIAPSMRSAANASFLPEAAREAAVVRISAWERDRVTQ
jgi:adenosine deaminase